MPFTPTHILVAIPIARRWNSPGIFTAIAIGSMIPDWPLYFPLGPGYQLTHSFAGIFVACLPMGLIVTLLFIVAARRALYELVSPGLQQRLTGYLAASPHRNMRSVSIMAVAVCIGAATHIIWDSFTHDSTLGVAMFPALQEVWITVNGVNFVGYMVLQHGSSLIGLPLMYVLYRSWYRRAECQPVLDSILSPIARWAWILLLAGLPLATVLRHIADIPHLTLRPMIMALYSAVTQAGFMFVVLIACFSLLFYPVAKYRQEHKT
jgi:hypothetical protein